MRRRGQKRPSLVLYRWFSSHSACLFDNRIHVCVRVPVWIVMGSHFSGFIAHGAWSFLSQSILCLRHSPISDFSSHLCPFPDCAFSPVVAGREHNLGDARARSRRAHLRCGLPLRCASGGSAESRRGNLVRRRAGWGSILSEDF